MMKQIIFTVLSLFIMSNTANAVSLPSPVSIGVCDDGLGATLDFFSSSQGCFSSSINIDDGDPNTIDEFNEVDKLIYHTNIITGDVTTEQSPATIANQTRASLNPVQNQFGFAGQDLSFEYIFNIPNSEIYLDLDPTAIPTSFFDLYSPGASQFDAVLNETGSTIPIEFLTLFGLNSPGTFQMTALIFDPATSAAIFNNFEVELAESAVAPVPLPAAFPMLLAGLIVILTCRRTRKIS